MAGTVKLYPAEMAKLLRGTAGPWYREMERATGVVLNEARRTCPVGEPDPVPRRSPRVPGTMRDGITKRIDSTAQGLVGVVTAPPPALWVHEGTQPHVITARNAPRLVFWSGKAGKVVYAKSVNHPGNKADPWLRKSLDALRGRY